jgi:ribonuclease-3
LAAQNYFFMMAACDTKVAASCSTFQPLLNNLGCYGFNDEALLEQALTHPSAPSTSVASLFQRLEFLGDRVLGLVIADMLYKHFPKESEGDLSHRLDDLVSGDSCDSIAGDINLVDYIKAGNGTLAAKSAILADAMEALIGAIYKDGGLSFARLVIRRLWLPLLQKQSPNTPPKRSKPRLQEWTLATGRPYPNYKAGPNNVPIFTVEVSVEFIDETQLGEGSQKKRAEENAAKKMMALIEALPDHSHLRENFKDTTNESLDCHMSCIGSEVDANVPSASGGGTATTVAATGKGASGKKKGTGTMTGAAEGTGTKMGTVAGMKTAEKGTGTGKTDKRKLGKSKSYTATKAGKGKETADAVRNVFLEITESGD